MGESSAPTSQPDARLFRDIFNASPIGIAVETLQGQPLFVNPALCAMLGFSEEELRSKHCVDFSPWEDAQKDWALFQQLRAGAIDHYQIEKRYFRRDGSLVWGNLSISLLNSRLSPLVLAMVEDITEQKRAEEALRRSEERFRLATLAGRMFAYEWDAATDVIVRSADVAEVLGNEPLETTGQQIVARIHPDDREKVKAAVGALSPESPHLQISHRMARSDGTFIWVERTGRAHFDEQGKMLRVVGMVRDITERWQAERELSQTNERLNLTMEAGRIGGWEWDIKSGKKLWFGQTHDQLGTRPEVDSASTQGFWDRVHPEDRGLLQDAVQEAMQNHKELNVEFRVVWPNGSVHWLGSQARFFYGADGRAERMLGIAVDITERKLAEDAVRESEVRYRRIVETANEGVWRLDSKLHSSYVNRQMAEMLGYEPGEMVGRSVLDFYFPEDVEPKKQILMRRQQGRREQLDERLRRKDGSELWVRMSATPVFKDNGEFDGAVAMMGDITERKRAEEAQRESEERFRLAAQAGRMYAYTWDATTDVIVRSGSASGVFGSTGEAPLTRKQTLARVHPDDRAIFDASVSQHTPEHPDVQICYRMLRPDGSVVWVEKTAHAMFDEQGRMIRAVGMVADITERKRAEETVRDSEEKFRNVFREAGVGMVIVSPEGRFLAANRTFCDYLGYTEEELLAKNVESVTLPEDWPSFSQKLSEALREGYGFQWVRKRCLHKSGRVVYTESSASVIRSRDGYPQYFVAEVLDITKRKEAEEALSAMTRKLIEAQEQERARIGRELHDDINQRIAMLAVELEQLQHDPSHVDSRVQELRKTMAELSNDVQALSHDLHSSKLEYLGVVAGIKSWCREFAERQRIEIDFKSDVPSLLPREIGLTLFRVLQEALQNAIKHSGVKRVEVQLGEGCGEIHLVISDLGRGFDVEAASHGTGLGLTSMRERVRLLNGTISIESKPMGGTTIDVRVPLESEHAAKHEAV